MSHLIIAPIVLPAVLAPFMLMVLRHHLDLQRIFSVAGTVGFLVIALALFGQAADGDITVYELGAWPAPFGIVLVLDRLSALMVLLTAVLANFVLLYSIGTNWDKRGHHFHPLFQFQLMGLVGAFLTGDAFNLFVFFEVLLIASYGLMIHGGGQVRLRAGLQYVVYNLIGSTLFLFALGTIYAVTGTLNMADLAERVAALPVDDTALIRVGAVMLLLVFSIKAAVLPLHFWLPGSYANAPAPVAALFAIMTKVGAYSILRMYTLVFAPDLDISAGLVGTWLLPAALATLAVGMIGILGAKDIARLVAFAAIGSMGTLLTAIALFTPLSAGAAIYYILHSTLATALMFLIADMVIERRGSDIAAGPKFALRGLISALYFCAAIALAGMPPLSGFLGKLMVLQAATASPNQALIWVVILGSSLVGIVGFARAGSLIFWKTKETEDINEEDVTKIAEPTPSLPFVATFGLLVGLVTLTIFAGPVLDYTEATAGQLFDSTTYRDAVLRGSAE